MSRCRAEWFVVGRTVLCALAAIVAAPVARACVPIAIPSAEQSFRGAGAVFRGTVVEVQIFGDPARPFNREARIAVEAVLKGAVGPQFIVGHSDRTSCGVRLNVGARGVFFTEASGGRRSAGGLPWAPYLQTWGGARGVGEVARRYGEEVSAAERRVQENREDIAAKLALASVLEGWGDVDRAAAIYDELAAAGAADTAALLGRGRVLLSRGRSLDAIVPLARVVASRPQEVEARFLLEQARLLTGELDVPAERDAAGLRLMNLGWRVLPQLSVPGRSLSRAVLAQVSTERADFTAARLDGATILGSFLLGVVADNADLSGVRVEHSVLAGMSARQARLEGARFRDVSLSGAFSHVRASGVEFETVRSSYFMAPGARFDNARFTRMTVSQGDFRGALLDGARFDEVAFYRVDFSGASLRGAIVRNAQFYEATFDRTDLTGADLTGADFTSSTLTRVRLSGVRLGAAQLRNARLSGVDLSHVTLAETDLRGMRFDCHTQFPQGFEPARSGAINADPDQCGRAQPRVYDGIDFSGEPERGADFSDLDLSGASFRGTNLSGARFFNATLRSVDFSGSVGAWLAGAVDLTNANFTNARGVLGLYGGHVAPRLDGAVFRGATLSPLTFFSEMEFSPADLRLARLEGAIMSCESVARADDARWRAEQIAWIRRLDIRRRGIVLADDCSDIPELNDLR